MTSRFYSSVAQATSLSGSITSGATSCAVLSTAGFPTSYPYTLALDFGAAAEELVDVTNAAGLTLTITRASDGTSASSHSAGAVVRHVASGRDFSDSRTHENASTNVHGLTGGAAVVGDIQAQTLTNKTLTSPTVNSGVLAGTFTGTPTLSGAVTLSGGGTLTGTFTSSSATLAGTFAGTPTLSGAVVLSGTPNISTGAALAGTFTGTPTFSGAVTMTGGVNSTNETVTNSTTGTVPLIVNGIVGTTAKLASLRVNAVEQFAIDNAGQIAVGPTWTTYSPVWSATGGTQPVLGNGTLSAEYVRMGNVGFILMQLVAGSTTTFGTAANWLFSLPPGWTAEITLGPGTRGYGTCTATGAAGKQCSVGAGLLDSTHITAGTQSGHSDGTALTTSGFIDALTPDTWTSGGFFIIDAIVRLT